MNRSQIHKAKGSRQSDVPAGGMGPAKCGELPGGRSEFGAVDIRWRWDYVTCDLCRKQAPRRIKPAKVPAPRSIVRRPRRRAHSGVRGPHWPWKQEPQLGMETT